MKVDPMRIVVFDRVDLQVSLPFLKLLLAVKRSTPRLVNLKPYEPIDAVAFGEAGDGLFLVLPNPSRGVGCRADVKDPVEFTGEQIDVEH
jgi:hypothetical protein